MFETSVVHARVASRSRFSLLTVSLIAHSAIVLGAIAISVASVDFPTAAPDELAAAPLFMPVQIPPPLGVPEGSKEKAATPPAQTKQPTPQPAQVTAPPEVPDNIPTVESPSSGTSENGSANAGSDQPFGVPWGVEGSPGELNAPPIVNAAPVEEKIYTVSEVTAPVMIRRVEPVYPGAMMRARLAGKVVVRCVIDKNGRVRDPQVIYATNAAFSEVVIRALDKWRYTPASLRGQAVDCYMDLSVDFHVK